MNNIYSRICVVGMAAMFFMNMPAGAAEVAVAPMRYLSGEITRLDVKLGIVGLKNDAPLGMGEVTEYRINKNDTRVTDPLDQKFLTIDDLQVGQFITIDVVDGQEQKVVNKITAQPYLVAGLQQAFGTIEGIDLTEGMLTLDEKPKDKNAENGNLSYFVFAPKDIVIMQDPSIQPVQLVLKPGDQVRVIFISKDEKKQAQSITLYAPKVIQTTVTTTTTTTQ